MCPFSVIQSLYRAFSVSFPLDDLDGRRYSTSFPVLVEFIDAVDCRTEVAVISPNFIQIVC